MRMTAVKMNLIGGCADEDKDNGGGVGQRECIRDNSNSCPP